MMKNAQNRFYFSDSSYYDIASNTIIDIECGKVVKYTSVSATEGAVLKKLIQIYPNSVAKEYLCTVINASCGHEEVRRVVSDLKKKHEQLKMWIPRARDGKYQLRQPISSVKLKPVVNNSPPNHSCILKSTGICTRPNFVKEARVNTFNQLDEAFAENHVVFLQGIGGIGKSETAKHWALQKKKEGVFDTVVFAQLNSDVNNSNVQSLITDDTIFVISGDFHCRNEEESIESYFHRKLAMIKQITNERTLLVIDNYDIDDPQLASLFTGPYRLLVTTRNKQTGYAFPQIPVSEIQEIEYLKKIFFNNLDGERDDIDPKDPYIEMLFTLVSNHTLTIEIIAKSLVNSTDTPETLFQKICNHNQHSLIRNIDGLVERNFSEEPLSPFDCIRLLFNLSRLEYDKDFEYKSQILVFMAAMPTRGIELSLFKKWSNNLIIHAKNSLVQKSWLRQNKNNGVTLISMHPLIREIVWHELEPTLEKCAMLIEGLTNDNLLGPEPDGLYHCTKNIKDQYENIAISLLTTFPISNLSHFDFYLKLQILFHYCARADYAYTLVYSMKEVLEQMNKVNTWEYGYTLCRIGLLYETLIRDSKNAIVYLNDAISTLEKTATDNEHWFKLAVAYRALATVYCRIRWDNNEHVLTREIEYCLNKSEMIATKLIDIGFSLKRMSIFQGTVYVWKSKYNIICGDLEQAELWLNQAEKNLLSKDIPI